MTAFTTLPDRFAWSARELADAMPRRLSDSMLFQDHAPSPLPPRRCSRRNFLPHTRPVLFRVC